MTESNQGNPRNTAILLLAIIAILLLLPACALLTPKPMLYESDDYVVYRAAQKETADSLAKKFLGDEKKAWIVEDANGTVRFKKGQVVIIPLIDETLGGLKADGIQTVPILCYHRLTNKCNSSMCLPPKVFDQQMKYLKDNGYRTISLEQLQCFLEFKCSIPEKSVIITLDDGYRSAYDVAYPILKKYGFTATLFIYTDYVGVSKNAVTWNQLVEMKADGFEIGSHTVSHADLTQQREGEDFRAYQNRIEDELGNSKRIIDKKLNQNTTAFAFPFGRYNGTVLRICRQKGYVTAVSVKRGSNPFFADPLALKRNQIMKTDIKYFVSRLKTFHNMSLR